MKMKTVLFYSSVSNKSLFKTQRFYQIDILLLKKLGFDVILSNKVFDAFKFWKFDIVFAYFYRYSFFIALIAFVFGKRTFFTGGIDALDKTTVKRKYYYIQKVLFLLCYLISKKCIIVSKSDYDHVVAILNKRIKKLYYSEHTVDCSRYPSIINKNRAMLFSTIAWMGSVDNVKRKGIDKALHMFSLLKGYEDFKDAKFIIIGRKGEGTLLVEKLIDHYDLSDSVLLTGEISEQEKIEILTKSKYYFQLSTYEGFGIAALEGLMAGAIVIHSGRGGLANPVYKSHILVNINNDINHEIAGIVKQMRSVNYDIIYNEIFKFREYYDNSRRLNDLKNIMG